MKTADRLQQSVFSRLPACKIPSVVATYIASARLCVCVVVIIGSIVSPVYSVGDREVAIGKAPFPSGSFTVHDYMIGPNRFSGDNTANSFQEYLERVVFAEAGAFTRIEMLKAQAVGAATKYLASRDPIDNSVNGTTDVQAYNPIILRADIPLVVKEAVAAVLGPALVQNITYDGANIDASFFSNSRNHRTLPSEQSSQFGNYSPYRRATVTDDRDAPPSALEGPRVGMSQYGALAYAIAGWGYEDIIKHYYGPAPPYLEAVRVIQGGLTKYERRWADDNDFNTIADPRPTRTLRNEQGAAVNPSAIIGPVRGPFQLRLDFSEPVKASGNFSFRIGDRNYTASDFDQDGVRDGGEFQNPPERWTINFYDADLQTMDGNHQISVATEHELIPGWSLDRNPGTMYYQLRGQNEERNYEPGADVNHSISIDNFRPFIQRVTILQGTERYKGTWQYVNTNTRRLIAAPNISIDTNAVQPLMVTLSFSEPMNPSVEPRLLVQREHGMDLYELNKERGQWSTDGMTYAYTARGGVPFVASPVGPPPSDRYRLVVAGDLVALQNQDPLDAMPGTINRKDANGSYPGSTGTNERTPDKEHLIRIGQVLSVTPAPPRNPRPPGRRASGRSLSMAPEVSQPGLRIVADVAASSSYPIRDVRLYYRPQNSADKSFWNWGEYSGIPMASAGNGKYVAVIPPRFSPQLNKDILDAGVEWMIVATAGDVSNPEVVTYPADEPTIEDFWPVYKPQPAAVGEQPLLARVIAGDQYSPYGVVNRGDTDPGNDFWRLEFYVPEGAVTSPTDIEVALAGVDNSFGNETTAMFTRKDIVAVTPNDWMFGRRWRTLDAPAEGNWSVRLQEISNPQIFTDGDYLLVHAAAIDPVSNAIVASRAGSTVTGGGSATMTAATAFIGGDLERPVALAAIAPGQFQGALPADVLPGETVVIGGYYQNKLISFSGFASLNPFNGPAIAHTALGETQSHNHPYEVVTTLLSDDGLTSAELRVSRNGGPYTVTLLTGPVSPQQALAGVEARGIIDTGSPGDRIDYFVEARDDAGNPSWHPGRTTANDTRTHRFNVVADVMAPRCTGVIPASGDTQVLRDASIEVRFEEDFGIEPSSLSGNIILTDLTDNRVVAGALTYEPLTMTAIFDPSSLLAPGASFRIEVRNGIHDLSGNPLANPTTQTFITRVGLPPKKPVVMNPLIPNLSGSTFPITAWAYPGDSPITAMMVRYKVGVSGGLQSAPMAMSYDAAKGRWVGTTSLPIPGGTTQVQYLVEAADGSGQRVTEPFNENPNSPASFLLATTVSGVTLSTQGIRWSGTRVSTLTYDRETRRVELPVEILVPSGHFGYNVLPTLTKVNGAAYPRTTLGGPYRVGRNITLTDTYFLLHNLSWPVSTPRYPDEPLSIEVEYYGDDFGFTQTIPFTGSITYQIPALPRAAFIAHRPASDVTTVADITLSADTLDDSQVQWLKLWYKRRGDPNFVEAASTAQVVLASIPDPLIQGITYVQVGAGFENATVATGANRTALLTATYTPLWGCDRLTWTISQSPGYIDVSLYAMRPQGVACGLDFQEHVQRTITLGQYSPGAYTVRVNGAVVGSVNVQAEDIRFTVPASAVGRGDIEYYFEARDVVTPTSPQGLTSMLGNLRNPIIIRDRISPSAPSLLSPASGDSFAALPRLSWNALGEDEDLYVVVGQRSGGTESFRAELPARETSFLPAGLADGTYNWSVQALDANGNMSVSETRSFVFDATPPASSGGSAVPTVDLVALTTTSSGLRLSWSADRPVDAGAGLARIEVLRGDVVTETPVPVLSSAVVVASLSPDSSEFFDAEAALHPNARFGYIIRGVDRLGNVQPGYVHVVSYSPPFGLSRSWPEPNKFVFADTSIVLLFSESIDPASVDSRTVRIARGDSMAAVVDIAGRVTVDSTARTITINGARDRIFEDSTRYVVTLDVGLRSATSAATLDSTTRFDFYTAVPGDITGPSGTISPDGALDRWDIRELELRFRQQSEIRADNPRYLKELDVYPYGAPDGVLEFRDICVIARNYGLDVTGGVATIQNQWPWVPQPPAPAPNPWEGLSPRMFISPENIDLFVGPAPAPQVATTMSDLALLSLIGQTGPTSLPIGTEFTVDVNWEDVPSLNSTGFTLEFDTSVVEFVEFEWATFDGSPWRFVRQQHWVSNTQLVYDSWPSISVVSWPGDPISYGSAGSLGSARFRTIGPGATSIRLGPESRGPLVKETGPFVYTAQNTFLSSAKLPVDNATARQLEDAAPTIIHTRVSDGRIGDFPVTVEATVLDSSASAGVSARLFYRPIESLDVESVAMTVVSDFAGGKHFIAEIPGARVKPPGISYYMLAKDWLGNSTWYPDSGELSFTVVPDTRPEISILSPAEGETFSVFTPMLVDFAVWVDTGSISNVRTLIDDSITISDGEDFDLRRAGFGSHRMSVSATSSTGMTTETSVVFNVLGDSIPVLALRSPEPKLYRATDTAIVIFDATVAGVSVDRTQAMVDGFLVRRGEVLDFSLLPVGKHAFRLTATSNTGDSSTTSLEFTTGDFEPPIIDIVSPAARAYSYADIVTTSFTARDEQSRVDAVSTSLDGAAIVQGSMITMSSLSLGPHTFKVVATDQYGNTSEKVTEFEIVEDVSPTIVLVEPVGDTHSYSAPVRVIFQATDDVSGVIRAYALIGDQMIPSGGFIRTDRLPLGENALQIFAYDKVGNVASIESPFRVVDDVAPTLSVTAPAYTNQDVVLDMTASDERSETVTVTRQVATGPDPDEPYSAEGAYEIVVAATDVWGNRAESAVRFVIDKTPPTVSILSPTGGFALLGSDVTVHFTAADILDSALTIAAQLERLDGTELRAVQDGDRISSSSLTEGAWRLAAVAADRAGNTATARSEDVLIDRTSPAIIVSSPVLGANYLIGATIPTTFVAADNLDGFPAVMGILLGPLGESRSISSGETLSAAAMHAGEWHLNVQARDAAGNISPIVDVGFSITHDIRPPRTSASVGSPNALGGTDGFAPGETFVTSMTAITLSSVDDLLAVGDGIGLGVARTTYTVDGGLPASEMSFTLSGAEGRRVITFGSEDVIGNAEVSQTLTLNIDNAPPVTETSIGLPQYSDSRGLFVTSATPETFASRDTGAGLATPRIVVTNLFGDGIAGSNHQAIDLLGNRAETATISAFVDNIAPAISIALGQPMATRGGIIYVMSATPIVASAVDSGAGLASLDTATIPSTDGPAAIAFRASDRLGNSSETMVSVTVDNTAPVISISSPVAGSIYVGNRGSILISFAVIDNLDSIPATMASLNTLNESIVVPVTNGAFIAPANLAAGQWELKVTATDFLGNASSASSGSFTVRHDVLPPRTSSNIGEPKYGLATKYLTSHSPVNFSSTDDLVTISDSTGLGVVRIEVALDTAAFATFADSFLVKGSDGAHVIAYRAIDKAGNVETTHMLSIFLDNSTPLSSLAISQPSYVSDVLLNLGATTSGITFDSVQANAVHAMVNALSVRLLDDEVPLASNAVTNIVAARPIYTLVQLDNVSQVGPSALQALRDFVPSYLSYLQPGGDITKGIAFTAAQVAQTLSFANTATSVQLKQVTGIADSIANTIIGSRMYVDVAALGAKVSTIVLSNLRGYASSNNSASATIVVDGVSFSETEAAAILSLVNTASAETLAKVPAIDPVKVSNIIAARPIATMAALGDVPLIGPSALRNLRLFVGGSATSQSEGLLYVAPVTLMRASAQDAGVGVRTVTTNLDSTGYAAITDRTNFTEGLNTLAYRSDDFLLNLESTRSQIFAADGTPPVISLTIGTPQANGGAALGTVIKSTTDLTATAADPGLPAGPMGSTFGVTSLPGAGVKSVTQDGSGAPISVTSPFRLSSQGTQILHLEAKDNVENIRETGILFTVDDDSPNITESAMLGGRVFVARRDSIFVSVQVLDTDPNPAVSIFLRDEEESTVVSVANGQRIEPLLIDDGFWRLVVEAADWVGNSTTYISGRFEVIHDIQPPRTSASVGTPRAIGGATGAALDETFVTSATVTTFSTIDDLVTVGDSIGLGVARTEFRVGADSFQTGTILSLSGGDGPRVVGYRSIDVIENAEAERQFTLYLDNTSPTTETSVGDPQYRDLRGVFVTSATSIIFADSDAGVGIAGEPVTMVHASGAGSETLTHTVTDLLGHATTTVIAVIVDNAPPATSFVIGDPKFVSGGTFITSGSAIEFTADDASGDASGAGVARIEVSFDSGGFETYVIPITFSTEGAHSIQYRALDQVGNVEAVRRLDVIVDNSSPVTALEIGLPRTNDTVPFVTSASPLTLTAVDRPAGALLASGIASTQYRQDAGAIIDGMTFIVTGADGLHTVGFFSTDNLGNAVPESTIQVNLDNTPPVVFVAVGQPEFTDSDGRIFGTSATTVSLIAVDTGAGLSTFEVALDGGSYMLYTTAIAFPAEGSHVIAWRAADRLGLTTIGETRLYIDNTAPVTTLSIEITDTTGAVLIPESLIALTASDAGTTRSGLASTEWRLDSGVFQEYFAPFEVGRVGFGSHSFIYRSTDNVGNATETTFAFRLSPALEVVKTRSFAPRTLVWWNYDFEHEHEEDGDDEDHATPAAANRARIERAVHDESLLYDTVTSRDSFVTGMRSGRYNLYVILGDKNELEGEEANELAERVNLGAGVIAGVFDEIRGPKLAHDNGEGDEGGEGEEAMARDNVLGVKVAGRFSENNVRVEFVRGILADTAFTIAVAENPNRVKENVGDFVANYLGIAFHDYDNDDGNGDERGSGNVGSDHGSGQEQGHDGENGGDGGNGNNGGNEDADEPVVDGGPVTLIAATHCAYGLGEAVFLAFDIAKAADESQADTIIALMRRAMQVTAPDTEPAIAGGVIAVEIRVKSLVVPLDLAVSIEELLPSDVNVATVVPPATISGGALVWTVILDAGQETSVRYEAVLPSENAVIQTEAIVSYLIRGTYRELGRLELSVAAVESRDNLEAARDIITTIIPRVLQQGGERSLAEDALRTVNDLIAHPPITSYDRNDAVKNLLKAIEDLTRIEDAIVQNDITFARRALDRVIAGYEILGIEAIGDEHDP